MDGGRSGTHTPGGDRLDRALDELFAAIRQTPPRPDLVFLAERLKQAVREHEARARPGRRSGAAKRSLLRVVGDD